MTTWLHSSRPGKCFFLEIKLSVHVEILQEYKSVVFLQDWTPCFYSCWDVVVWHCDVSPQIHRLIPNPQYLQMWLFEGGVSDEVIRWKGARSVDPNAIWPVSSQTRGDYNTEEFWRMQGGDGRVHTEERGLKRNQPYPHLGPGLPASETVRK